ncbi:uncharacterized protein SPAPADRAFT_64727 [Spathaspora passalidarum NRRL Y-27907]|uniref:Uncharacterized protein n=1 Tax=Spathaspora passalidarum (strain NRRL Y-27907 / 11-Y1) TaxID=619300 RepID=G3AE98_SPAPN|nr:uncharacterized protein SPAPADRAFT_64727 [Spathaspora passalidarum NRRL Y-27907]EGW35632.1 hypothetical protein SPAPADRAFT_64727 [Spathaspora passalidarum NRRL Y-27907]
MFVIGLQLSKCKLFINRSTSKVTIRCPKFLRPVVQYLYEKFQRGERIDAMLMTPISDGVSEVSYSSPVVNKSAKSSKSSKSPMSPESPESPESPSITFRSIIWSKLSSVCKFVTNLFKKSENSPINVNESNNPTNPIVSFVVKAAAKVSRSVFTFLEKLGANIYPSSIQCFFNRLNSQFKEKLGLGYKERYKDLSLENVNLINSLVDAEEELKKLKSENGALLDKLKAETLDLNKQLNDSESKFQKFKAVKSVLIQKLNGEISELKKQLNHKEAVMDKCKADKFKPEKQKLLKKFNTEKQALLKKFDAERLDLKEQLSKAEDELVMVTTENTELMKKYHDLELELHALELANPPPEDPEEKKFKKGRWGKNRNKKFLASIEDEEEKEEELW